MEKPITSELSTEDEPGTLHSGICLKEVKREDNFKYGIKAWKLPQEGHKGEQFTTVSYGKP